MFAFERAPQGGHRDGRGPLQARMRPAIRDTGSSSRDEPRHGLAPAMCGVILWCGRCGKADIAHVRPPGMQPACGRFAGKPVAFLAVCRGMAENEVLRSEVPPRDTGITWSIS